MSVTTEWHDDHKTVILYTVSDPWTWDEMYKGIDDCYAMMETVQHSVDTIFDIRESNGLPPSALANIRTLNRRRHENSRHVVVIGLRAFHRSILNTFARLYGFSNPNGVHFVADMSAALLRLASESEPVENA